MCVSTCFKNVRCVHVDARMQTCTCVSVSVFVFVRVHQPTGATVKQLLSLTGELFRPAISAQKQRTQCSHTAASWSGPSRGELKSWLASVLMAVLVSCVA